MFKYLNKTLKILFLFILLFGVFFINSIQAVRVKDIAYIKGGRQNQLIGYSIVIGLNGSGDSPESLASRTPLINALERIGVSLNDSDIIGRSVAAVMVTAILPPFAKQGNKIDVVVSTIGDAITLRGGVLLMSPLRAANREIFAVAQGVVMDIPRGTELDQNVINGIGFTDQYQNYLPTVGRIVEGATIEKEIDLLLNFRTHIYFSLKSPDFTTAYRTAQAINREFQNEIAKAEDAGTIEISVPPSYLSQTVELVSKIENLQVLDDSLAKVVIDERSGTIIIGDNVTIAPVAISMNNINLLIREEGIFPRTAYTPKQLINEANPIIDDQNQNQNQTDQEDSSILPVPIQEKNYALLYNGGVNLKEIVNGLNKIGATNRELIDILKNLKAAGAINGELIIR